MPENSFDARATLEVGDREYEIFRIDALHGDFDIARLPFSLKVLLENLLRNEDGVGITKEDVEEMATWVAKDDPNKEISFTPARVLMQDFTGVPAIVDLAAMRDAMADLGGDPEKINPLVPAELVIDHSVQVDFFGTRMSFERNAELEFERNKERYAFLRWGQGAFENFKVVPPDTGIVHQVNLEYLARVVFTKERDGVTQAYPDTLVGTDSHTTMINGLAVLGWGVGGIEAEAAMLGQPMSMLIPQVVGLQAQRRAARRAPPRPTSSSPSPRCCARTAWSGSSSSSSARASPTCRSPTARRSRTWRPSTARPARSSRSTRRRIRYMRVLRPAQGAARAGRGLRARAVALARPRPRARLHGDHRARPRLRRAVAGRPAPPAGSRRAHRGQGALPRRAG